MKFVFICSPYRGDIEGNTALARKAGHFAAMCGAVPMIPHLVFPQFLMDDEPAERVLGIKLGMEMLKTCDELWLIGGTISEGMRYEIETAKQKGIPICCFDVTMSHIDPETISVDPRVSETFRVELRGAKIV